MDKNIVCKDGSEYKRIKYLDEGSSSKCYVFEDCNTRQNYVGKIIDIKNISKKDKRYLRGEVRCQVILTHPNVVKIKRIIETGDEKVVLMLDYCSGGTLMDLVDNKKRKRLRDHEIRFYLRQMLEGLEYIHRKRIIHRDIKLNNIFLDRNGFLKIGDFGYAMKSYKQTKTSCGTPNYVAPEIVRGPGKKGYVNYTYATDMWALGVCLYYMATGKSPFMPPKNCFGRFIKKYHSDLTQEVYRRVYYVDYIFPDDVDINSDLRDIIEGLLVKRPRDRLTIDDILESPYLRYYRTNTN
jgi:serine/threonine protein kinase